MYGRYVPSVKHVSFASFIFQIYKKNQKNNNQKAYAVKNSNKNCISKMPHCAVAEYSLSMMYHGVGFVYFLSIFIRINNTICDD